MLTRLSQTLCESGHLPSVVQAAHLNLIISTAFHHAANANAFGWNAAVTYEAESGDTLGGTAGHLQDVWPYWMDRSEAVSNSFDMDGLFLLTAPNMSGKSTLMRSTAAAALLSNCGLCAPVGPGSMTWKNSSFVFNPRSMKTFSKIQKSFTRHTVSLMYWVLSCSTRRTRRIPKHSGKTIQPTRLSKNNNSSWRKPLNTFPC